MNLAALACLTLSGSFVTYSRPEPDDDFIKGVNLGLIPNQEATYLGNRQLRLKLRASLRAPEVGSSGESFPALLPGHWSWNNIPSGVQTPYPNSALYGLNPRPAWNEIFHEVGAHMDSSGLGIDQHKYFGIVLGKTNAKIVGVTGQGDVTLMKPFNIGGGLGDDPDFKDLIPGEFPPTPPNPPIPYATIGSDDSTFEVDIDDPNSTSLPATFELTFYLITLSQVDLTPDESGSNQDGDNKSHGRIEKWTLSFSVSSYSPIATSFTTRISYGDPSIDGELEADPNKEVGYLNYEPYHANKGLFIGSGNDHHRQVGESIIQIGYPSGDSAARILSGALLWAADADSEHKDPLAIQYGSPYVSTTGLSTWGSTIGDRTWRDKFDISYSASATTVITPKSSGSIAKWVAVTGTAGGANIFTDWRFIQVTRKPDTPVDFSWGKSWCYFVSEEMAALAAAGNADSQFANKAPIFIGIRAEDQVRSTFVNPIYVSTEDGIPADNERQFFLITTQTPFFTDSKWYRIPFHTEYIIGTSDARCLRSLWFWRWNVPTQ